MKKSLLVITLILLASLSLSAASFKIGVEALYNYNFVTTYNIYQSADNPNVYEKGYSGFDVAIPVEFEITEWFSVNSAVRYLMKNTHFHSELTDLPSRDLILIHSFIEFPLSVRFSLKSGGFRIFVGGGAYLGYWAGLYETGNEYSVTGSDSNYSSKVGGAINLNEGGYNRFDAGYFFEQGFSYSFDFFELYLNVRYQRSLTKLDQSQRNGINNYIDTLSAGAGVLFRI